MCDHPVGEEQELDEETKQALEQLAKTTAEGIAAILGKIVSDASFKKSA